MLLKWIHRQSPPNPVECALVCVFCPSSREPFYYYTASYDGKEWLISHQYTRGESVEGTVVRYAILPTAE